MSPVTTRLRNGNGTTTTQQETTPIAAVAVSGQNVRGRIGEREREKGGRMGEKEETGETETGKI